MGHNVSDPVWFQYLISFTSSFLDTGPNVSIYIPTYAFGNAACPESAAESREVVWPMAWTHAPSDALQCVFYR